MTQRSKFIVTEVATFLTLLETFLQDSTIVNEIRDSNSGVMSDWNNKDGKLSMRVRSLIKSRFPIRVGFAPWIMPHCSAGIFLILAATEEILLDMTLTLKMSAAEFPLITQTQAIDKVTSVLH
jgi:hypothetical protein